MGSALDTKDPDDQICEQAGHASTSLTTNATCKAINTIDSALDVSQRSQLIESQESPEETTQVLTTPRNHHEVLTNYDLLKMIFGHFGSSPQELLNVLKVCKHFYLFGTQFLWERADTNSLVHGSVPLAHRRQELALFVKHLRFSPYEVMWPSGTYCCPTFENNSSVDMYSSTLSVNDPEILPSFLGSELRDLRIRTASIDAQDVTRRDDVLLSHLGASCAQLTSLTLEVALNVSSLQMVALFAATPRLKALRLGHQLNTVLDRDAIWSILTLPHLEKLSMEFPLGASMLDEFLASTSSTDILPRVREIKIIFSGIEDRTAGILLSKLKSLHELTVSFLPTTRNGVVASHAAFLHTISVLPDLRTLTLYLSSPTLLTIPALSAIASMENLTFFNLLSPERNYHSKPAKLSLTAEDMIRAPINFRFLQMLDVIDMQSPIVATYSQAVEITQKIDDVSASYMCLFDLSVDEGKSFGWPSASDYEAVMENTTPEYSIWKGSLKSFSPDPASWIPRDLKAHINKHGKVVPMQELVTDGQYNPLN